MKKIKKPLVLGTLLLAGVCAGPVAADPILTIQKYIPIPSDAANHQPNGQFNSFDISYADPVTGNVYIADRSNASVDFISGSSLTFLGRATGFTGQGTVAAPFPSKSAGADGVVTVTTAGTTILYAGDGDSTLKMFNVTNPAAVTTAFSTLNTGGSYRVDEMAYSPLTKQVVVANNADAPAFGTLVDATTGLKTAGTGKISIPGAAAGDGLEQPAWNTNTSSFFVSVPAFNGDAGGIAELKTDGTVGALTKFASIGGPAACSPTGLAVGGSGNMMVGCGAPGSAAVLLHIDPATHLGTIIKTFPGLGGTDELWYDPTTRSFYVTGVTGADRFFDVISDVTDLITQTVTLPLTGSAHSIAVDPLNGDVFVALAGTTFKIDGTVNVADLTCPLGCIAVYGVPEPDSLPMLLIGAVALLGLAVQRRRRGA